MSASGVCAVVLDPHQGRPAKFARHRLGTIHNEFSEAGGPEILRTSTFPKPYLGKPAFVYNA
jgi:hypothetical protein